MDPIARAAWTTEHAGCENGPLRPNSSIGAGFGAFSAGKPRQCWFYENLCLTERGIHDRPTEANSKRRPASRTGAKLCRCISHGPTDINASM